MNTIVLYLWRGLLLPNNRDFAYVEALMRMTAKAVTHEIAPLKLNS